MMVQILLSERDTASGVTDAPSTLAAARRQRRPRGSSGRQRSRCEVRQSECGDDERERSRGGGNDGKKETGSIMHPGD